MTGSRPTITPGRFYWVKRRGEDHPTVGQVCSTGSIRLVWLVIGDEQEILTGTGEIEVIAGPLPEPTQVVDIEYPVPERRIQNQDDYDDCHGR